MHLCLARVLGESSSGDGGESFPGRKAVEKAGNTTDDCGRVLENACHSGFRVWGKEDRFGAMEGAAVNPVGQEAVFCQDHGWAGVTGESGAVDDRVTGQREVLKEKRNSFTVSGVDAPAQRATQRVVSGGGNTVEEQRGPILFAVGDRYAATMDLIRQV